MSMGRDKRPELEKLAFELFKTFARIEYALKHANFLGRSAKAAPNWDTFACSVVGKLEADTAVAEAVKYMQEQPPLQEMVRGGQFAWERVTPNKSRTHELLLCVRRVRNNLFHGGKFDGTGSWFAPDRSEELIKHSLTILNACLRVSPQLKRAFDGD